MAEIITLIGSHNLLTTPSRADLDDPALRPLIDEMLHGADGATADERAAVFRMAWDLVGSALGGRGFLYERFYLTSAARNKQMLHTRFFDRTRANALVEEMLALAGPPNKDAIDDGRSPRHSVAAGIDASDSDRDRLCLRARSASRRTTTNPLCERCARRGARCPRTKSQAAPPAGFEPPAFGVARERCDQSDVVNAGTSLRGRVGASAPLTSSGAEWLEEGGVRRAFVGGRVEKMDAGPRPSVVIVSGDRIESVGELDLLRSLPEVEVVDLQGRMLLPGFIDADHHLSISVLEPLWADLSGVGVPEDAARLLADAAGADARCSMDPG